MKAKRYIFAHSPETCQVLNHKRTRNLFGEIHLGGPVERKLGRLRKLLIPWGISPVENLLVKLLINKLLRYSDCALSSGPSLRRK